jgi:two-component system, NarL family, response regulator DevR
LTETLQPHCVLVVEDHQVLAEGLLALLAEHPDLKVLGWARSVAEALVIVRQEQIDVALIDYWLPDGRGPDLALAVRQHQPDVALIFLSADDSDDSMLAALEAGASGYLVKTASGENVAEAIRRAAAGEMLLPAHRVAELLGRRRELSSQEAERLQRFNALTPRERQILDMMASGMDNREIAVRLGISYTTVRSHVRSLLDKLGARSKLEAVARASDWGLIERID